MTNSASRSYNDRQIFIDAFYCMGVLSIVGCIYSYVRCLCIAKAWIHVVEASISSYHPLPALPSAELGGHIFAALSAISIALVQYQMDNKQKFTMWRIISLGMFVLFIIRLFMIG